MIVRSLIAKIIALSLLGIAFASPAATAQEKKTLTISIWGFNGDLYQKYLFKPFEDKYNVNIVLEPGNAGDRLNKVKIRGGGVDLIYLSDVFSQVGIQSGVFEKLDLSKLPNLKDLYSLAQAPQGDGYGPAYTVGKYGIIYDSAKVANPVTAWSDLWKPEFKGRVTMPAFSTTAGPLVVLIAGERKGVDAYANPDAAFASLAELKPNLVKTYTTGSELVNLFTTGEAVVAGAQDFTFPQVKAAIPTAKWADLSDKDFATFNTVNVVEGTQNKELAEEFINFHLGTDIQTALAIAGTDAPANAKVVLTPEQAAPWTYGDKVISTLRKIDYAKLNGAMSDWTDRWNDIFGR